MFLLMYDFVRGKIMEYLTTVELSERWNITSRRIGVLCAEGRIEGAIKKGKNMVNSFRCNKAC